MTKTTVKAHTRKGTRGVKSHPRNLSKKKKVPHRPYRDEIEFTREASTSEMIERTEKILSHIRQEDIESGLITKTVWKIRPDYDQLRREWGYERPPESLLKKRNMYEYSFYHNLNKYTCRLEKDSYPLCTRSKKGKETIIRDNTFIKRLDERLKLR